MDSTSFRTTNGQLRKLVCFIHSRGADIPDTHDAILPPISSSILSLWGQANLLVDHYASISRLPHSPADRMISRRLLQLEISLELSLEFTTQMVCEAIRRTGFSTARGLDGISYAHLTNLGPT